MTDELRAERRAEHKRSEEEIESWLQEKALRKLKHPSRSRLLQGFLET